MVATTKGQVSEEWEVVVAERSPEEDRADLVAAYTATGLELNELWVACFALGGNVGRYEIEAYLAGLMPISAHEHNVVAHVVNERLVELESPRRAPYREPEQ